jgi:uncharacterized membrane protein
MVGFHFACMRKMISGRLDGADIFKGFNFFAPALLAMVVISVFTFLGSLFCIIPGLVIAAMYQFAYLYIFDKKLEFWPAMQASHELVKKDYWLYSFHIRFGIVGFCWSLALSCRDSLYFPTSLRPGTAAYKDLVGFETSE